MEYVSLIVHIYRPRPPLSDFVDLIWLEEVRDSPRGKERVLPTGTITLILDLGSRASLVSGAHSQFFVLDSIQPSSFMGVHFKPGGAFPFFQLPLGELQNAVVTLDALWGASVDDLRDQLLAAGTPHRQFRVFEKFLLVQAAHPLVQHPAITFALKTFERETHAQRIAEVTEQIGLSRRRFTQLFSEAVGLAPKQFCRVRRFQAVLQRIEQQRPTCWADLALACGYYDQAHFIHEFRALSGFNPTTYLAERGERLNHVSLRE